MFPDISSILDRINEFSAEFLPKLLLALAIFLIGYILARILRGLINRLMTRIHRYVPDKTYQLKIQQISTEPSVRIISKIIYWIIIIFFLTAATEVLGLPIITAWLSGLVNYMPNVLLAALIVFSGIIGGRLLREFITATVNKTGASFGDVLGRLIYYSIIIISILIAISQIGVELGILTEIIDIIVAAIMFSAALAFGLGAKTSVSNILAGYYIRERYHVGNLIKIEGIEGRIVEITTTSVVIETDEGVLTIPAQKFSEEITTLIKKG
jgi:small-conductance mechanosensitive channel